MLSESLDRVRDVLLVCLDRDEELPALHDLRGGALHLGRHGGTRSEAVVQLLDQVRHPPAEALEQADAEIGEQVEDSSANQGRQRVLPSYGVVEAVGGMHPGGQRGPVGAPVHPEGQVEVLARRVQRVEVRVVEHPPVGAGPREVHAREVGVLLRPVLELSDAFRQVAHGEYAHPPESAVGVGAVVAHEAVVGAVERALEPDVAQRAEAVGLAGEDEADVDARGLHVAQAYRRVPVARGVDVVSPAGDGGRRSIRAVLGQCGIGEFERLIQPQGTVRVARPEQRREAHVAGLGLPGAYGGAEPGVLLPVLRVHSLLIRPVQLPVLAEVAVRVHDHMPVVAHRDPPPNASRRALLRGRCRRGSGNRGRNRSGSCPDRPPRPRERPS